MSEAKTKPIDCYLRGVRTEGVGRTISSAERGLKNTKRADGTRKDAFEESATPLSERADRNGRR